MMALELEDRARARGARDLRDHRRLRLDLRRLSPRPDGSGRRADRASACTTRSRSRAAPPEEIGYINYHGTSTQLNDAIESRCTRLAFGNAGREHSRIVDQVDDWPPAGRQRIGRAWWRRRWRCRAASCRRRSTRPRPDPDCDLDFIPNQGREASPVAALCNCLGFGSKNSALVLGRARWMTLPLPEPGPAGALAATILAKAGLRVRVFDRARFPRHKLCGDTLNPGALAVLQRHVDVVVARREQRSDRRHAADRAGRRARPRRVRATVSTGRVDHARRCSISG